MAVSMDYFYVRVASSSHG